MRAIAVFAAGSVATLGVVAAVGTVNTSNAQSAVEQRTLYKQVPLDGTCVTVCAERTLTPDGGPGPVRITSSAVVQPEWDDTKVTGAPPPPLTCPPDGAAVVTGLTAAEARGLRKAAAAALSACVPTESP